MSAAGVIYNMKTDTLEFISNDIDKRVRVTGGNYYAITDGDSTTVYDGSGNQVMAVREPVPQLIRQRWIRMDMPL